MIEHQDAQKKGYITLKEAAALSNYSSDYIGQLIRAGKIEGEQVYNNVAWVTTEASLQNYLATKNKKVHTLTDESGNLIETAEKFGVYALYSLMTLLVVACLVLFYIFSVSLDRYIAQSFSAQVLDSENVYFISTYE